MKKTVLVAGARPNFMKLAPLWHAMKARPAQFDPIIVHTGQHYDRAMSDVFFDDLRLPTPDIALGIGSGTHTQQTARIMLAFEAVLERERPDWVIVFGDVNSTTAAALVAAKELVPVAHVEAGLRSGDRTMPEEINRLVTDHLADLLFTSCPDADDNLMREGIAAEKIRFVGNIMIDSLNACLVKAAQSQILDELRLPAGQYALVTLHRPVNVDDRNQLEMLVKLLTAVANRLPVAFPVHPRTRKQLDESGLMPKLEQTENISLCAPLGYTDFLRLERDARVVLTDSGGVQEETTALNVPCLTLRDSTERPVTIWDGTNRLVGTDPDAVLTALDEILASACPSYRIPRYWDGHTAGRICDVFHGLSTNLTNPQQRPLMTRQSAHV